MGGKSVKFTKLIFFPFCTIYNIFRILIKFPTPVNGGNRGITNGNSNGKSTIIYSIKIFISIPFSMISPFEEDGSTANVHTYSMDLYD